MKLQCSHNTQATDSAKWCQRQAITVRGGMAYCDIHLRAENERLKVYWDARLAAMDREWELMMRDWPSPPPANVHYYDSSRRWWWPW